MARYGGLLPSDEETLRSFKGIGAYTAGAVMSFAFGKRAAILDTNVDPSSTMQVVNQLIKHNKDFDLLVVPGMDHGSGGAYGDHKRFDFFARHLLGVKPPEWKLLEKDAKSTVTTTASR